MSIEQEVIDIVVEQLGVDAEEVTLKKSFVEDLNADSLDLTELIMTFEERFGFEIPEEEIMPFRKKLEKTFQQKIEPTSALAFASVVKFLEENPSAKNQNFLVIISGGNVV